MEEVLVMERNIARDVGLFSPPRKTEKLKHETIQEWEEVDEADAYVEVAKEFDGSLTSLIAEKVKQLAPGVNRYNDKYYKKIDVQVIGYSDENRDVYLPAEFAELLADLPFGRVSLTGLVNIWLRDGSPDKDKQHLAVVQTTLGEICRTVGLSPNGPNRMKIKRSLRALNLTRFQGLRFFNAVTQGKRGKTEIKARYEVSTSFLPHLEFLDVSVNGRKTDTTVIAYICRPLTLALKLDTAKARIPLAALKATYGNTKATRAMQNVLFWISAVTPEYPGQPLHPRIDTLINDVMRAKDNRRDKNIQRLSRILNNLQKTNVIAWWKFDGEYCLIMKKRDQEILEKKGKKKALVSGDAQGKTN